MKSHTAIPKDWPVQPLKKGVRVGAKETCGHCGLSWDDSNVTSMTPAPSARCPFEQFHVYPDDEAKPAKTGRLLDVPYSRISVAIVGSHPHYAAKIDGYDHEYLGASPDEALGYLIREGVDLPCVVMEINREYS